MASVRYPALAKQTARLRATVVLPQPPFALASVKMCAMVPSLLEVGLRANELVARAVQRSPSFTQLLHFFATFLSKPMQNELVPPCICLRWKTWRINKMQRIANGCQASTNPG